MLKDIKLKMAAVVLVLSSIAIAIYPTNAVAQNPTMGRYQAQSRVSREVMRSMTKRGIEQMGRYGTDNALGQKLSLPPLPGEQGYTDSAKDPLKFQSEGGAIPDFGLNDKTNANIVLPPLKGLSQILDSKVTSDLLKRLTQAEATVLMQTYMMVENGAATGFMGGMNIGSNLMSNLLQTQDLQLKLMDITDDTGKMKAAYAKGVAKTMQSGEYKDIWPAALYMKSGEDGKALDDAEKMKNLDQGSEPYDLSGLDVGQSTGPGNPNSNKTRLLSEMLFIKGTASGTAQAHENDQSQINELKQDFIHLVGDVEIKIENSQSKTARDVKITYKAPEADNEKRRGVAAANWEEVGVVWESMNKTIHDICNWKKSNPNNGKEIFKMETVATAKNIGQDQDGLGMPWEIASAPDMPLTINIIEQLYALVEHNHDKNKDIDCNALLLTAEEIPDDNEENSSTNLNDCGPKKGCLKNRVVLHLSFLVARSRTLFTYRTLYTISKKFATDPFIDGLLEQTFARTFAGMDIDAEIRSNRARYGDFVSFMAQLAQGDSGAGAFFRPGGNEAPQPGSGGFSSGKK